MRTPAPRRWVQGLLFLGFLSLFARTAYRGSDLLDWPVHLIFKLDPLAAIAEVAAAGLGALGLAWVGAFGLLAATAALGRFFCGWMCPTGTSLDVIGGGLRRFAGVKARRRPTRWTAPALLAGLLTATFLGLPLLGVLDPLSLLLRSLTLVVQPFVDAGAKGVLDAMAASGAGLFSRAADSLYGFLDPVLAFGRPAFLFAGVTGLVMTAVLALELAAPRTWCTSLCPLGALLGVTSRLSPFRRLRSDRCGACAACVSRCPSGAASLDPADSGTCLQCGTCERVCPRDARRMALGGVRVRLPPSPTRRAVLVSGAVGAGLAIFGRVRAEAREVPWRFLRPPGAHPEEEFTKRCIRCGACMRVCPRGALHPSLFEAGPGGLWTPRLVPRIGYCEYHCRLCGQVCPTGALRFLAKGDKEQTVIGIALFDRDRCIPYRKAQNCMVCEEHCPTNPKAIVFREERRGDVEGGTILVKVPEMVEPRCIGCGICEHKCPVPGRSAILVTREIPGELSTFY